MKRNFEKPIDSTLDIYEQGKKLYFPKGTFFPDIFANSELEHERIMGQTGIENGYFHSVNWGSFTEEFEKVFIFTINTSL